MVLVASVEYADDPEKPGTKYATTHFDLYRDRKGAGCRTLGQPAEEQGRAHHRPERHQQALKAMKHVILLCLGAARLPLQSVPAAEPIVTDSRLITEERRLQILEAKLASLQREVNLIEDRKAIERLQQMWGHYVSEGMAREAAALFSASPVASIEYAQQGVYLGKARIEAFLKASGARVEPGELRETPVMQAVIHIAADGLTAKGRWRSLVMGGMHGQDGQLAGRSVRKRIREGRRRLEDRPPALVHDRQRLLRQGLASGVLPDCGPAARPAAGSPAVGGLSSPSRQFFLPPFHFLHPVTGKPVAWDNMPAGERAMKRLSFARRCMRLHGACGSAHAGDSRRAGPCCCALPLISPRDWHAPPIASRRSMPQAKRIDDYNQLRNLQQIYGFYYDEALWDQVVDLFADDATWKWAPTAYTSGATSIRRYFLGLTGGKPGLVQGQLNNQIQLSPVITLAADGQSAQGALARADPGRRVQPAAPTGAPASTRTATSSRTACGRSSSLQLYLRFYAPYEGGWTRTTAALNARYGKSTAKADRPPAVRYETWPTRSGRTHALRQAWRWQPIGLPPTTRARRPHPAAGAAAHGRAARRRRCVRWS